MPKLEGSVESIVFRNEDSHYTFARFRPNDSGRLLRDDLTTIVGALPGVQVGELLSVEGEWETDPRYGRQLHVASFVQRLPASPEGIARYLSSGFIKHIGPRKAQKIVDHFGEQTLAILEQQPERLNEVKGISAKDRERIITGWNAQAEIKELHLFLQSHEVSLNLATRIYKQYGQGSIDVVRENPYQLADEVHGVGFRTADDIAVKLGLPLDSQPRLAAGLKYALAQAANEDGHCFVPARDLLERASEMLHAAPELLAPVLTALRSDRDIFIEPPFAPDPALHAQVAPEAILEPAEASAEEEAARQHVYFAPFWHAEQGSARLLRTLTRASGQLPPVSQENWDAVFAFLAEKRAILLTVKQREAVQMAYSRKVSILTGGPGTGKSTSLRALLMVLRKRRARVALAAPTGRAAKRLTEATGAAAMPAKTLHRLLEFIPHDSSYLRNEDYPLPYDFVIVDEVSMIDILLFYHLLKALPPTAHLLLVGDADQLPSVGPGNVLRDLLRSEAIPCVRLTDLFRQAAASQIIVNAHRINAGQVPSLKREPQSDFYFLAEDDPTRVQQRLLDYVQNRIPHHYHLNPLSEIQVLAPMYKGVVGVSLLNEELQARLNPDTAGMLEWSGHTFRRGDKVMQTRNNYDKGVFNGDIGWIRQINKENSTLTVEFLEEAGPLLVEYEFHELDELVLAYAITIHKSQGSEYPAIVVPLVQQHYMLLQRNLLYTAITRAKRLCIVIGQPRALEVAVKNDRVALRNTALAERLRAMRVIL
ncbi:MAG TPA: ATP-dependent RecD-like DNA helicase, partial [Ktedonobacteraceae bacterium]|nr:ATP-dependent RecD-like DNA helicase [Ktedonobacteraceae bacterium]